MVAVVMSQVFCWWNVEAGTPSSLLGMGIASTCNTSTSVREIGIVRDVKKYIYKVAYRHYVRFAAVGGIVYYLWAVSLSLL